MKLTGSLIILRKKSVRVHRNWEQKALASGLRLSCWLALFAERVGCVQENLPDIHYVSYKSSCIRLTCDTSWLVRVVSTILVDVNDLKVRGPV